MAQVTAQYIHYVEEIRQRNLELAAEYLLMAAMLIEIKSRMLLPPKKQADGEDAGDPRAELVRRLLEYEQIKLGAQTLDSLPQLGRDFYTSHAAVEHSAAALPDVSVADLASAWGDIIRRAKLVTHHTISREELSVREYMSIVLKKLQGKRFVEFGDLFEVEKGLPVLVVTFVAMLELARENLLEITQGAAFAPIYVRLVYQNA
jgi:segregation and condensation protein A